MNNILNYNYLNNISDIISLSKDIEFNTLLNKLNKNLTINVSSHLIHNKKTINHFEQFIFNLDNYISFLKNHLFINPMEIRIIASLTIYNKFNDILFNTEYYYNNPQLYEKEFIKMFMNNYNKNIKFINRFIKIKKRNFNELTNYLNNHKKRVYIYFENINSTNIHFYLNIIKQLEEIN